MTTVRRIPRDGNVTKIMKDVAAEVEARVNLEIQINEQKYQMIRRNLIDLEITGNQMKKIQETREEATVEIEMKRIGKGVDAIAEIRTEKRIETEEEKKEIEVMIEKRKATKIVGIEKAKMKVEEAEKEIVIAEIGTETVVVAVIEIDAIVDEGLIQEVVNEVEDMKRKGGDMMIEDLQGVIGGQEVIFLLQEIFLLHQAGEMDQEMGRGMDLLVVITIAIDDEWNRKSQTQYNSISCSWEPAQRDS